MSRANEPAPEPAGLGAQMYTTEEPLAIRVRTHKLYTQPQMDFQAWVLDHVPWRGDEQVLDIGCGSGSYVEPVCERLRRGGRLLAGDLSWGMLRDLSARSLPDRAGPLNADVMRLPLCEACCDVVLVNHMLYHVPQIEVAVSEIHRVLRSGGRLVAATNAQDAMQTFIAEMEEAGRALGHPFKVPTIPVRVRFTLENGRAYLRSSFAEVERDVIESALVFSEAAPAIAYINTTRLLYEPPLPEGLDWERMIAQVERQIRGRIADAGLYRVLKTAGVFVATKT